MKNSVRDILTDATRRLAAGGIDSPRLDAEILLAHVLGWQCVVNKGLFRPMDRGVYFEIDSFLPVRPEFLKAL